ncbi:MAG: hypothetical protein RLZZ249_880 [Actinomycetota bacterium]|jgi:glycosyltransferase involved in cell wall biosynthesis
MKTLVLMPTYNEAAGIMHSLEHLLLVNQQVDVLVIDDNSPDGTAALVERIAAENSRVSLLKRGGKEGLGKAYLAGYRWGIAAGYQRLVQMDADGSHRPEDLSKLLSSESPLVIGSRWVSGGAVENWPLQRQLISRFGNWYAAVATGLKVRDLTAGFRVYSASLIEELQLSDLEAQGYGFQVEMTRRVAKLGAEITEVPITFIERETGASKMTHEIVLEAFWLCTKWGIQRLFRR